MNKFISKFNTNLQNTTVCHYRKKINSFSVSQNFCLAYFTQYLMITVLSFKICIHCHFVTNQRNDVRSSVLRTASLSSSIIEIQWCVVNHLSGIEGSTKTHTHKDISMKANKATFHFTGRALWLRAARSPHKGLPSLYTTTAVPVFI